MAVARRRTAERAAFSGADTSVCGTAEAVRRVRFATYSAVSLGTVMRRYGVVVAGWNGAELDGLIEEVLVDAYNDSERQTAFESAFDEATFPISGRLFGRPVVVSSVVFDGDDRRRLRALVSSDRQSQELDLLDITLDDVPVETARLVAAYRRWWVPAR